MHRAFAASKTLVFMWYKKFQDGFINLEDGSRAGQPKTFVTNVNIAAVEGPNKRDARLTLKKMLIVLSYNWGQLI